jgi:hypothetical protein
MPNPLIPQGTLNRLRASITWPNFANLNIVSGYLGRMGIRLALDGDSTLFIQAMTGTVTSPEPYMMMTLTAHLLKSQPLAAAYKQQMELSALLGDGTVRSDSAVLTPYQVVNCAIQSVRELNFAGDDGDWAVTFRGQYYVNSNLFNG